MMLMLILMLMLCWWSSWFSDAACICQSGALHCPSDGQYCQYCSQLSILFSILSILFSIIINACHCQLSSNCHLWHWLTVNVSSMWLINRQYIIDVCKKKGQSWHKKQKRPTAQKILKKKASKQKRIQLLKGLKYKKNKRHTKKQRKEPIKREKKHTKWKRPLKIPDFVTVNYCKLHKTRFNSCELHNIQHINVALLISGFIKFPPNPTFTDWQHSEGLAGIWSSVGCPVNITAVATVITRRHCDRWDASTPTDQSCFLTHTTCVKNQLSLWSPEI